MPDADARPAAASALLEVLPGLGAAGWL